MTSRETTRIAAGQEAREMTRDLGTYMNYYTYYYYYY